MMLKEIANDLEKLDELYSQQIGSFDSQLLPDLEEQIHKRATVFKRLKANMEELLPSMNDSVALDNLDAINEMIEHLSRLHRKNDALKTKALHFKEGLQKSMTRLNMSKKAINAYGSSQSFRNRPKVLTIREY